jgi:anaerobic selenocysteine-containing dehydrogenase
MPFVEKAVAAGARIVVVDPRRTETAERAELLVQPRPGSDLALALDLAHILFRENMVDEAFVDAHVLGHESYRQAVEACTPEWAGGNYRCPHPIHRAPGADRGDREAAHHLCRLWHAAIQQQRADDARDHRAAGAHGQRRSARSGLAVRQPAERDLR